MHCSRCKDKNFLISCACGCGGVRTLRTKWGDVCRYLPSHSPRCPHKSDLVRNGRYYIHRPEHPMANYRGLVARYRIVYEEYHRCCLLPNVEIHHIDGNPSNDQIANLKPMHQPEHMSLEVRSRGPRYLIPETRICADCGSTKTRIDSHNGRPHWYKTDEGKFRCRKCADKERKRKDYPIPA